MMNLSVARLACDEALAELEIRDVTPRRFDLRGELEARRRR